MNNTPTQRTQSPLNDDLIRAQFVAAAIPTQLNQPAGRNMDESRQKLAVVSNNIGDDVMAEFIRRRNDRLKQQS